MTWERCAQEPTWSVAVNIRSVLITLLTSPHFIYKSESPQLTSVERAHRLSYFLWSSMPDDELRKLADNGEILKPAMLTEQTRRLLASPRSNAFVTGFLDSWLNLRSLGDMPPDRDAFERYYWQDLQTAMKRETQMFMRDLIEKNASITRFLDADYTFVNQPLASLYGLGSVSKPEDAQDFRRVSLTDRRRGGLLGQGSVLTVSANGIETSPVVRGIWLLENILGTPPPPPPDNVPPIDPDVRGTKSIRERLAKHRDNPGCLECHQKIDPLGFALENFDPIGQWRTHYPMGKKQGPKIDPAGELPDGKSFEDITGLKKILLTRQDQFAKMLTEKLLAYACGRRMEGLDREQIDDILAKLTKDQHGMRSLIEHIVLSETFAR